MGGSVYWDERLQRGRIKIRWQGETFQIYVDKKNHEPFESKERLARWFAYIQGEITNETFNPHEWRRNSPLGIDQYAMDWLDSIEVSNGTMRSYRAAVRNYIVPFFGDQSIRGLRHVHIVRFKKSLENLSSKTVFNIMGALKTMIRFAYQNEDVPKVPPFPRLGYDRPEKIEYLTMEQQDAVLSAIPDRHRPIYQFMMEYGLRPGEARALKKDCLSETTVTIKRTFSNWELRETTKTGLIRSYSLTTYAISAIDGAFKHLGEYVFVQEQGLPYSGERLNRIWRAACEQVGIKIKLYNGVRHSKASNMVRLGMDYNTIRQTLGHTDFKTTLRYAADNLATVRETLESMRSSKMVKIEVAK